MQQEVDYNNYRGDFRENKRADWDMRRAERQFNDFNPTPTKMSFPIVDAQPFTDVPVSDVPLAPLDSDVQNMSTKGSFDAMDMMGMNTTQGPATETQSQINPPVEEPGFFDKIGSGMSDFFGDEERMARMTIALNSMRLNPDPNIAKSMENKLESINKRKGLTSGVKWLRQYAMQQTDPAKKKRFLEMAIMAEQNPTMAKDILKSAMESAHGIGGDMLKTFSPRVDEQGKEYIPVFDPNTNSVVRKYTGTENLMTDMQKVTFETSEKIRLDDVGRRDKKVAEIGASIESVGSQIDKIDSMVSILDEGAMSGFISNVFPTFQKATAQLNQVMNYLGLDVIGSVTFGALSESELKLAMDTAVPRGLAPKALKQWAIDKASALRKFRTALYQKVESLTGADGYNDWIIKEAGLAKERTKWDFYKIDEAILGKMTYSGWSKLNIADRKKWIEMRQREIGAN
jgi:hypothetical protein